MCVASKESYYNLFVPFLICQFTHRMMISGSEVFPIRPSPFRQTIQSIDGDMIQRSAYDPYDIENNKHTEGLRSGRWTVSSSPPAKMKIMRRKATSEYPEGGGAARKPRRRPQAHQDAESQLLQQQQQHAMGVVVRVCSDCNTTKTPLWRSGPCGPKVNYQCNWEIKALICARLRFSAQVVTLLAT